MAKVCILTAGLGRRMGVFSSYANKAILPIDSKAVLTHIIEKFPQETEYVIGLGHLREQVVNYLTLAHPELKVKYVEVDNIDDEGSGPGYSLTCCQEYLSEPFYFVACDTLWNNDLGIDETRNWVGVDHVGKEESGNYCNFEIRQDRVLKIKDKQRVSEISHVAFAGLCFIKDHDIFWEGLADQSRTAGEVQISNGLQALILESELHIRKIDWIDLGSYEKYQDTVSRCGGFDFSKSDEFLYLTRSRVIKFFSDSTVASRRVKKAKLNPLVFPEIIGHEGQFYAYSYVPGKTMYASNSSERFTKFLHFMDERVWIKSDICDQEEMSRICQRFYYDKTLNRIQKYFEKYSRDADPEVVGGVSVPSITELIDGLPWNELYDGIPRFIHGDLQFDNVLWSDEGNFVLLDWRQDFGGAVEVGDLYYDLGKLAGGILINYDYVKLDLISYSETKRGVDFDFATRFSGKEYRLILEDFVIQKGWNLRKVHLIVPLIYLNMSPLHHYPFDKILFALGKLLLYQWKLEGQLIED